MRVHDVFDNPFQRELRDRCEQDCCGESEPPQNGGHECDYGPDHDDPELLKRPEHRIERLRKVVDRAKHRFFGIRHGAFPDGHHARHQHRQPDGDGDHVAAPSHVSGTVRAGAASTGRDLTLGALVVLTWLARVGRETRGRDSKGENYTFRPGRWIGCVAVALLIPVGASTAGAATCASSTNLHDQVVTVGSFDFAESRLARRGVQPGTRRWSHPRATRVRSRPREFVAPALAGGLVEFVPEYAGTALRFLSLGAVTPGVDVSETHAALLRALERSDATALTPAPAQNANAVLRDTSDGIALRPTHAE